MNRTQLNTAVAESATPSAPPGWDRRLAEEARYERWLERHSRGGRYPLGLDAIAARVLLRLLGLEQRGQRNTLDYRLNNVVFTFEHLPATFDGFRILQLSDMHFDANRPTAERIASLVRDNPVDLCVFTGDFQFGHYGPYQHVLQGVDTLMRAVHATHGFIAVLGNHDRSDYVDDLRNRGIRLLINDATPIEQRGDQIWVAGVDDPHRHRSDSLPDALAGIPSDAFKILLAHSPELFREAADAGIDFYLCGHTHCGQIRLPLLGGLIYSARCPRRYCNREWIHGKMCGYTTSGLGETDIHVRFNCPPEAVIVELRRKKI